MISVYQLASGDRMGRGGGRERREPVKKSRLPFLLLPVPVPPYCRLRVIATQFLSDAVSIEISPKTDLLVDGVLCKVFNLNIMITLHVKSKEQ